VCLLSGLTDPWDNLFTSRCERSPSHPFCRHRPGHMHATHGFGAARRAGPSHFVATLAGTLLVRSHTVSDPTPDEAPIPPRCIPAVHTVSLPFTLDARPHPGKATRRVLTALHTPSPRGVTAAPGPHAVAVGREARFGGRGAPFQAPFVTSLSVQHMFNSQSPRPLG
jgi:hypothetical protein